MTLCSATELSKIKAGLKAERNPSRLQALLYSKAAALPRMSAEGQIGERFHHAQKDRGRVLSKESSLGTLPPAGLEIL